MLIVRILFMNHVYWQSDTDILKLRRGIKIKSLEPPNGTPAFRIRSRWMLSSLRGGIPERRKGQMIFSWQIGSWGAHTNFLAISMFTFYRCVCVCVCAYKCALGGEAGRRKGRGKAKSPGTTQGAAFCAHLRWGLCCVVKHKGKDREGEI